MKFFIETIKHTAVVVVVCFSFGILAAIVKLGFDATIFVLGN